MRMTRSAATARRASSIRVASLGAVFCLLALMQAAASNPRPADLGPRVGERLPSFSLRDQDGTPRALDSLAGPKGLVLVFFRSADW
jgi:cytochrome oxidase Cu insertion factor (SCO1/SenC/PrrC family)